MPFNLATLTLVAKPVTLKEGTQILERDEYRCQYCGLDGRASFENALEISVDFVMPRARKGKKDPSNLVACCRSCNSIKGIRVFRDFNEAKAYILKHREQLRKDWESGARQPAKKATKQAAAAAASDTSSKIESASVIGRSPLSLRKA